MANRKSTTSRNKSTRPTVKRSAPVAAQPERPIGGEGGWAIVPTSTALGLALIEQRKRAANTFTVLDEHNSDVRSARADEAMEAFSTALSYVPPEGPIEALAAALLVLNDLDAVFLGVTERARDAAGEALKRRIAGLAAWIELTHKVDRREFGFAGGAERLANLIPHTARNLNVMPEHDL